MSVRDSSAQTRSPSIRLILLTLVMLYGAIAGLQTVVDFDLGWQMADARNPLASGDVLSYTAPGSTWVYPPLAGIVFRHLFHFGGYAAISWFCAIALLATLAIVALRSKTSVLILLLIAVPALAGQMIPRSGIFTVVIAAAYTRVLLDHYLGRDSRRLWLLPLLMAFWVNLHTGFISGLGLMLGYIAAEVADCVQQAKRDKALRQLKLAAPWIAASFVCTLLNPWGFRIYAAIAAQEHISALQSNVIRELTPLYREFSWNGLQLLSPLSAIWWMLAASAIALVFLLYKRQFGLALFLSLAFATCLLSSRTQGVFLPVACLIAGEVFAENARSQPHLQRFAGWPGLRWAGMIAVLSLVVWRCYGLVTDRTSLREDRITLFGAGASWWLPQDAAAFIEKNHLPPELFSTFNLSSYLTWRLGPHYRDFADGRYLPFGDRIVSEQLKLTHLPLDSEEWNQAVATYHIKTVILPLSRFWGIEEVPLREDCNSQNWVPVYFDTTAIVFVHDDALPQTELSALRVDCQRQQLVDNESSSPNKHLHMEHYQKLANAAVLYFLLGRNEESQQALESASQIATDDRSLVLLNGQLQASRGEFEAAEESFHSSLKMSESDAAWYQLGLLYANQRRYPEAIHAFQSALRLAAQPEFSVELSMAKAEVLDGQANTALQTLQKVSQVLPDSGPAKADLYDAEAATYSQLSNWPAAVRAEEKAVQETPAVAGRWKILAAMYTATGRQDQALQAQEKAESLASQSSR
jgi:tetratricopeptide (TPR) repeat protein